jgi:hypothetical protein
MSVSNLMTKMFTTEVALGALHMQKSNLKFTAVPAELHSALTHPEHNTQFSKQETNIIWIYSVGQGADIFSTLCLDTMETPQQLLCLKL